MTLRQRRFSAPSYPEAWFQLRADYNMAKTTRYRRSRTGVSGTGRTGDYHYRSESEYLKMVELARDMDRNDCIVGQTVDRAVVNMIQEGIAVDPQTGDAGLDRELVARRKTYCEDADACDLAGELTYPELVSLAVRQTFVDGDIFALPTRDGPIQLVEGHRVRTPSGTTRNVVLGILLSEYRQRLEYWITKDEIEPSRSVAKVSDVDRYPARDADGYRQVFHLYNPKRVSQTRGVTALAPIVDLCGYLEDTVFARLVQQQVVSCFAIFRQRDVDFRSGADVQRGERSTETLSDGTTRTIEGYAPGMEYQGDPGETLNGFSPNVPNPEFFPFVKMILQFIGVNLGLPLVLVLLDASQTNFSGWRGAVDQARLGFRRNQHWLIARFLRPDYCRLIRQWLADDPQMRSASERSGIDPFAHRWQLPSWPYIQPREEATADLMRVRNAQTSRRRLAAERGMDFDELSMEIVEDNGKLIEKACEKTAELKAKYPDAEISWRDVAGLPPPEGVQWKIMQEIADEKEQPEEAAQ